MMKESVLLSILFVLSFADHHEHRVQVDVYYESLCPDSIKFFTKQLYPSLQGNLSNFINLTLVPYGKSSHKINNVNEIQFDCHHGPDECHGNKIQACAINKIDRNQPSEGLGYNKVTVAFINCLMDKVERLNKPVKFPTQSCAAINDVSDVLEIENCANHTDGVNYLANLGEKTNRLQSPLKSVPTIVFNNQYKKEDSDLAQSNFIRTVCQYIYHDKPAECLKNGVNAISLSFLTLFTCVFFYLF